MDSFVHAAKDTVVKKSTCGVGRRRLAWCWVWVSAARCVTKPTGSMITCSGCKRALDAAGVYSGGL